MRIPRGLPSRLRERIEALGPGRVVGRADLRRLTPSKSATDMFVAKALDLGLLVPVRWGSYQVAPAETLQILSMVSDPAARRLIAWAAALPRIADRPMAFLAPRLWRDTRLNVSSPVPILRLSPRDRAVPGVTPQWDAFFCDLGPPERWRLRVGAHPVGPVAVPNLADSALLLRAAVDPRWSEAAIELETALPERDRTRLRSDLASLWVADAPRGRQVRQVGLGPPHRRRLLAPPWWARMRMHGLESGARRTDG